MENFASNKKYFCQRMKRVVYEVNFSIYLLSIGFQESFYSPNPERAPAVAAGVLFTTAVA